MTEDTGMLIALGVSLVYGAFALAHPERIRSSFASPDATATTTATVRRGEAERAHTFWSVIGRRRGIRREHRPDACRVVTTFTVDGQAYSTYRPRRYDRARPQPSLERAARYCESRYSVGSGTRVVYIRSDPTVASIETHDFHDPVMPALQLGALAAGLGFTGFGMWVWRREVDTAAE